jgi:serine/threonine protein kinase
MDRLLSPLPHELVFYPASTTGASARLQLTLAVDAARVLVKLRTNAPGRYAAAPAYALLSTAVPACTFSLSCLEPQPSAASDDAFLLQAVAVDDGDHDVAASPAEDYALRALWERTVLRQQQCPLQCLLRVRFERASPPAAAQAVPTGDDDGDDSIGFSVHPDLLLPPPLVPPSPTPAASLAVAAVLADDVDTLVRALVHPPFTLAAGAGGGAAGVAPTSAAADGPVLGRGAFGVVRLGVVRASAMPASLPCGTPVAVKEIPLTCAEAWPAACREAAALASLAHVPGVVRLLALARLPPDASTPLERAVLTMECASGGSLAALATSWVTEWSPPPPPSPPAAATGAEGWHRHRTGAASAVDDADGGGSAASSCTVATAAGFEWRTSTDASGAASSTGRGSPELRLDDSSSRRTVGAWDDQSCRPAYGATAAAADSAATPCARDAVLALPARTVAAFTRELLTTLAAVHAAGVAHRDVKGSNVLLLRPQQPPHTASSNTTAVPLLRLADFGSALLAPRAQALADALSDAACAAAGLSPATPLPLATASSSAGGSPGFGSQRQLPLSRVDRGGHGTLQWSAPEAVTGGVSLVGPSSSSAAVAAKGCSSSDGGSTADDDNAAAAAARALRQAQAGDVWSVGCTVLELLTGRPPWHGLAGDSAQVLLHLAATDLRAALPVWLGGMGGMGGGGSAARDFICACLHPDPSRRPSPSQLLRHPFVCAAVAVPPPPPPAVLAAAAAAAALPPLEMGCALATTRRACRRQLPLLRLACKALTAQACGQDQRRRQQQRYRVVAAVPIPVTVHPFAVIHWLESHPQQQLVPCDEACSGALRRQADAFAVAVPAAPPGGGSHEQRLATAAVVGLCAAVRYASGTRVNDGDGSNTPPAAAALLRLLSGAATQLSHCPGHDGDAVLDGGADEDDDGTDDAPAAAQPRLSTAATQLLRSWRARARAAAAAVPASASPLRPTGCNPQAQLAALQRGFRSLWCADAALRATAQLTGGDTGGGCGCDGLAEAQHQLLAYATAGAHAARAALVRAGFAARSDVSDTEDGASESDDDADCGAGGCTGAGRSSSRAAQWRN